MGGKVSPRKKISAFRQDKKNHEYFHNHEAFTLFRAKRASSTSQDLTSSKFCAQGHLRFIFRLPRRTERTASSFQKLSVLWLRTLNACKYLTKKNQRMHLILVLARKQIVYLAQRSRKVSCLSGAIGAVWEKPPYGSQHPCQQGGGEAAASCSGQKSQVNGRYTLPQSP